MLTRDRIRILLIHRGNMSEAELARRLGMSKQSFCVKMKRSNFRESDLQAIADALDCDYQTQFVLRDTGERV